MYGWIASLAVAAVGALILGESAEGERDKQRDVQQKSDAKNEAAVARATAEVRRTVIEQAQVLKEMQEIPHLHEEARAVLAETQEQLGAVSKRVGEPSLEVIGVFNDGDVLLLAPESKKGAK